MRTVWLEDCAQEEQRESEEEDAEAAIAEHEKDRSGLEGAVTVAQCPPLCVAAFRGTQSCAVRASGGGAECLWSDTGVVLSLVSEGGLKLRIFFFLCVRELRVCGSSWLCVL